jgi:hypothetical protein
LPGSIYRAGERSPHWVKLKGPAAILPERFKRE